MRARKRFGQHFLEPAWVRKIVDAIAPAAGDTFIEIGPGRGALTVPLASRSRAVVAIEVDRDLAAALPAIVPPNVTVVTGDVLETDLAALIATFPAGTRVRVAGNLPYNISTPVLFALLALRTYAPTVSDATLMLQKEVVDRLTAHPGSKEYGVLAVLVGRFASIERVLILPPGAFRPAPAVRSAVARVRFLDAADVVPAPPLFEPLVRAVFTRRRKTMGNALAGAVRAPQATVCTWLSGAGVDPQRRPETLTIDEFAAVARAADASGATLPLPQG